jgi:hypothetical protein
VDTGIILVCVEDILLETLFFVEAGPDLTVGGDVLTWILSGFSIIAWMGVWRMMSRTSQIRHADGGEESG